MKDAQHRSSLFLVELIISLTLFAICAAVCAALLVHARGMSRESTQLTEAVYMAQSIAETWRSAPAGSDVGVSVKSEDFSVRTAEQDGRLNIDIYAGETLIYRLEGVTRLE